MTPTRFNTRPVANSSFNNLLDDFFAPFPSLFSEGSPAGRSLVPVNIRETENGLALDIVAPGFSKEDFAVGFDNKVLTVSAQRKSESEAKEEKFLRNEYKFASFKRSFNVAESIDGNAISAQYVNGVLTLNLPKKAEVKPSVKTIEIR